MSDEYDETADNLPAKIDQKVNDLVEDQEDVYRSLEKVSRDQQKYINLKVFTSMSKKEIGAIMGISYATMSKWDNDVNCQLFEKDCQKQYQKDIVEKLSQQNQFIQNRAFADIMSRMEAPDPDNDLPEGHTYDEKKRYLERFFVNLSAKDALMLWKDIDGRARKDADVASSDSIPDDVFVSEVKRRYNKIEKKRKAIEDLREKYRSQESVDVVDEDGNVISAQVVAAEDDDGYETVYEETTETFEITEYSIKPRGD